MSTLRINNIEAQSVPASPTIDEKVKVTNSSGDILVNIDGKTSGITTIGINTTDGNIKFDANSNVLITGILTATTLAGNFTPDSLEIGSNIKLGNAGVITATSFVGSGAASLSPSGSADELVIGASNGTRGITIFGATSNIFFGDSADNDIGQIQYEHSDNSMRFNTNTSERLRITSTGKFGINYAGNPPSEDVMICTAGQASPGGLSLSHLSGGNRYGARLQSISGTNQGLTISGIFNSSYTEVLRIDSSGRVLIGTTTEGSGGADELTIATSGDTGMTIRSGTSSAGGIYFSDGTSGGDEYRGVLSYNHANNYMRFYTDGTEKMRLDTNGSLRLLDFTTAVDSGADDFVVGTTNSGINRGMTILSHTGADARICFATASDPDEGMIKYSHGSDVMQFFVNAAERMRIQNLGDAEYGMKFFDNKAIEFKSNQSGIFSNTWYINPNTWTNFFSIPDYFQAWVFLNSTHNAGNSSALWSVSKSSSGGAHCNRFAHDNLYGPATVSLRINGVWVQLNSSYTTYGYAIINATAGGNGVANLAG